MHCLVLLVTSCLHHYETPEKRTIWSSLLTICIVLVCTLTRRATCLLNFKRVGNKIWINKRLEFDVGALVPDHDATKLGKGNATICSVGKSKSSEHVTLRRRFVSVTQTSDLRDKAENWKWWELLQMQLSTSSVLTTERKIWCARGSKSFSEYAFHLTHRSWGN